MKVGIRKPSVSKRVKARTTGRVKRTVKKAVIPYYGKKGTGIIKNPRKAIYNKVYRKTTIGVDDIGALAASSNKKASKTNAKTTHRADSSSKNAGNIVLKILAVLFFMVAVVGLLAEVYSLLLVGLLAGILMSRYANKVKNGSSVTDTVEVNNIGGMDYSNDDEEQSDIIIDVETSTDDQVKD